MYREVFIFISGTCVSRAVHADIVLKKHFSASTNRYNNIYNNIYRECHKLPQTFPSQLKLSRANTEIRIPGHSTIKILIQYPFVNNLTWIIEWPKYLTFCGQNYVSLTKMAHYCYRGISAFLLWWECEYMQNKH